MDDTDDGVSVSHHSPCASLPFSGQNRSGWCAGAGFPTPIFAHFFTQQCPGRGDRHPVLLQCPVRSAAEFDDEDTTVSIRHFYFDKRPRFKNKRKRKIA